MRRLSILVLLFASAVASAGESKIGGRTSPDGKEAIALDLPSTQHLRNKAGTDGLGLCVWTSITMSGDWCNEDTLRTLQQQMTREKGGGWPERVDDVLPRLAPGVQYVQYTGRDPGIIQTAIRSGRMPCVTYGYSPRYVGPRNPSGRIAHMVDCVHYSANWVAVLDNNFPGDDQYEWMAPAEFVRRWMLGNPNGGWVVLPLRCGPSPIPVNATPHHIIGDENRRELSGVLWDGFPNRPGSPDGLENRPTKELPHLVIGQCRGGSCPIAPADRYEWRSFKDDDSQIALLRNGVQVGGFSFKTQVYRPYNAVTQAWGLACTAPYALPGTPEKYTVKRDCPCDSACPCDGKPCDCVENFGVRQDKLPRRDGFSSNGRPITQAEAERALKCGGGFSDDSNKWRLTIIGPTKAKRDQVLNDLQTHPLLSAWKDRLCVQSYTPDGWAVTGVNLPRGGDPTIIVQSAADANGKATVLHCQYDYDDGPDGLVKALRAADPNFNPKSVPDLRKMDAPPAPLPAPIPLPAPTPVQAAGIHWLTVILSTAIPILLWLLGKSYPLLASVLTMIWNAVKPAPPPPTVPAPLLQQVLDRLSKLEQQPPPK